MTSVGEEANDAVLSDVEDDDPSAVAITTSNDSLEDVSPERFREVLAELDRERRAREAVETSKSDLQVSFNRLKVLAHEAIKKRDEVSRLRDEALRSNEQLSSELSELRRAKDEVLKERDQSVQRFDETVKLKDSLKLEVENAAQMLVTGIDKISGKLSNFKNFAAGGLPRSHKYTGLPAIAYGVIKRTNEIVEELVRQIDLAVKSRNEAREQMEQRNYEIAIEVSELEATIGGLREDVVKKTGVVDNLEKSLAEKEEMISGREKEMLEKQNLTEEELVGLRKLVNDYEYKFRNLEAKMDSQRPLLFDQLNYVAKIHDQIDNVIKIVDANNLDHSQLSESLFLPQETDMEENIRASLAGMESIYELSTTVVEKVSDLVVENNNEVKRLNETVSQLVKEKEHIGILLKSALSRRMSAGLSSKTNELFKVAENGLKEAGIDYKFSNHIGDGKLPTSTANAGALVTEDEEIYTLAGALENIIKQSQLEIIDLKHTVDELRAETSRLKQHVEAQAKELIQKKQYVEELEEKERVANENVEGLMMDIAAAEEEIARWKVAAQQEADAGKAVEQDFVAQLSAVRQELEEAKQAVVDSENKLKFKEETANAAMAARDAAEKSLRLADLRASKLRDKVEELSHKLEELDTRESMRSGQKRSRYVCWPWEWLGLNFVGFHPIPTQQESSNEMELSEPLI